jgi:adenine-specific DNA-methyltransferase
MTNIKSKKVNLTSSNLTEEKLLELKQILPEVFAENKIDWDRLKTVLGGDIDPRIEKFGFTWAGKSNAIKSVLIPSGATLRPDKDKGAGFDSSENIFIEGGGLPRAGTVISASPARLFGDFLRL